MPPSLKRKRATFEEENISRDDVDSDTNQRHDEDATLIRKSIERRNVREGTLLVKNSKSRMRGELGGGSFQAMGLHPSLLRALNIRGYKIPTPIQRHAIPFMVSTPPRDLVGMARTGSGKTLAYMIPLIQRLKGRHSPVFGVRALILVPARELALQVLKVGKELARGWSSKGVDHAGDDEKTSEPTKQGSEMMRWGLVVGGEGLDEQFEMISANPDVIIATPGRLLHLIVEMSLDLRAVEYVVFDEADRLFELGFATALQEILHRLPTTRQTVLFSATLPKSLVDFAKAGLQDPKLIRLDSESKISGDLRMAFFSINQTEKDASLLSLLRDVIGVPPRTSTNYEPAAPKDGAMLSHQTIIFVATKHHVEYLNALLDQSGYSVSYIYGTLDHTARSIQMDHFRKGYTSILVVTDVAARGIDIPILENVVNYDFPQGSRVFVHRVGRTARAGKKGWAWTFVTQPEIPFLLDLQLFLGKPLKRHANPKSDASFVDSLVLGSFPRDAIDQEMEYIKTLDESNFSLVSLREIMRKGHSMYERSKGKASQASYKRAKELQADPKWSLFDQLPSGIHPVLKRMDHKTSSTEDTRATLLQAVKDFRPSETVFEIGTRGKTPGASLMRDRRKALQKAKIRRPTNVDQSSDEELPLSLEPAEMADESDIEDVFDTGKKSSSFKDEDFYMSHFQKDAATEKGYSLRDGASFAEQAKHATFDLTTDEGKAAQKRRDSQLKWDRKKKKFIKGGGIGADNVKLIKTESGAKLPISYRSGRFEEWKNKNRADVPKVGELESSRTAFHRRPNGSKKFQHSKISTAKPLDKLAHDYERKLRITKKKEEKGSVESGAPSIGKSKPGKNTRWKGKSLGRVKNELKTVDQIRNQRSMIEKKRAKNARPTKRGRR